MGLKVYDGDKIDALCEHIGVDPDMLHIWSDNSITIGDNDRVEYYVTKGTRKYDELIGKQNGFNIYRKSL